MSSALSAWSLQGSNRQATQLPGVTSSVRQLARLPCRARLHEHIVQSFNSIPMRQEPPWIVERSAPSGMQPDARPSRAALSLIDDANTS